MSKTRDVDVKFAIRDSVHIDDDTSIKATIVGIWLSDNDFVRYECAWFANGDAKTAWIDEYRLTEIK